MAQSNFERMLALAEEVFDARHDPDQLDVDQTVIKKLQRLHPATLSEYDNGKGPVVWILIIPTTTKIMQQFMDNNINEKKILELTPPKISYDCIYLCSAMVLPEYRGKGIAKKLTIEAIQSVQKTNPIKHLFVWPFSKQGSSLAKSVANLLGINLFEKV